MPLLHRYNEPKLTSIGDTIQFFSQLFEVCSLVVECVVKLYHSQGLQFMHKSLVAHRYVFLESTLSYLDTSGSDCMTLHLMVDPNSVPRRYYYVNFHLSRQFENNSYAYTQPAHGGDWNVSEFGMNSDCYDPFPTDIYYIGNLIQEDFLKVSQTLPPGVQSLTLDMFHSQQKAWIS